jgi:hypothetical protein
MPKLTDTQTIILSRAATRPGNLALPLPDGLHGAAANVAVTKMIERGWLEEVDADIRKREPLWRETGDGHGTTLVATGAGLEAIGIEPVVAKATSAPRKAQPNPAPKPTTIRAGTKQARIIALLQRPDSRGDGRGGALAPAAGADRAALSEDRGEGWTAADAARDDAAGAFPAAVVCAQRSDGGRDAV